MARTRPLGILWLAALRLPADLRQAVYREEWRPDLIQHLQEPDSRPITRLYFGTKYAIGLVYGASKVSANSTASASLARYPRRRLGRRFGHY